MWAYDSDALICDFAETYHIYDLDVLPPLTAATLAEGLRKDSRIKVKMSGAARDENTMILAAIFDAVRVIVWAKTKDAERGRNRPKSLVESFMEKPKTDDNIVTTNSGAEFHALREKILQETKNGN